MSKKKPKKPKERNWNAVAAFQRTGAGQHKDNKQHHNKYECRNWSADHKED